MHDVAPLRILLVRPAYHTGLTRAVRLVTEPLELEYLAAVAGEEGWIVRIHDEVVTRESLASVVSAFAPDVVGITGYYPARDRMLAYARVIRSVRPEAVVVLGGVHAERNGPDFHASGVDLVVHSGGTGTLRHILQRRRAGLPLSGIPGTCAPDEAGRWVCQPRVALDLAALPRPDRAHFMRHRECFTYLHYGPVALVKTAYGCPFGCSFCYCRTLNEGRYTPRDVVDVADEIAGIDCERIWIVDDTFLIDGDRLERFAAALDRRGVHKQFIIYSRAGFIAQNPQTVATLKRMGVIDVIVGLEAVDSGKLAEYKKGVSSDENRQCVELLRAQGLACSGLFIMDVEATIMDFVRLKRWIRSSGLTMWTVSIFSPFPGVEGYAELSQRLTTTDCRRWDLLHLVLPTRHMPRWLFYLLMLWLHAGNLRNPLLRRHVYGALFAGRNAVAP